MLHISYFHFFSEIVIFVQNTRAKREHTQLSPNFLPPKDKLPMHPFLVFYSIHNTNLTKTVCHAIYLEP